MSAIPRVLFFTLFMASAAAAAPADRWSYVDGEGVMRWRGDNTEIALFGVNYYTPFTVDYEGIKRLGLDHRTVIRRDVAQFTRLGLDAIRLHVFDRQISDKQGNLIANEHLDLFDYLVAQCKRRGIYTVLTPIAWWRYHSVNAGFSSLYTKPQMVLDPQARKAQMRYLRQFMDHVNPYTKLAYKDEPAIVAIELINEPICSRGTTIEQIRGYIDDLASAVRSSGAKQPIFYNGWQGKEEAVAQAKIEGCTFGWYPTGLVSGHCLYGNFLPRVDDYPRMRVPCLKNKAKIVYEFDAADVPGRVMYPAMARAFRSGGAQIATQFQYDPTPLAAYNYGWNTHYLNMIYAPGETVSFAIAAEVFHRIPRLAQFGKYPDNTKFGPFRIDFDRDLSEMAAEDAFMYANNTDTMPPAPAKLRRIMGCGSSPVIEYDGTGAYFLDRLSEGVWRLEVYPDAVWVADPHGSTSLSREVSRVIWRKRTMTIKLPGLGDAFRVQRIAPERGAAFRAKRGALAVEPGAYVLARVGVAMPGGAPSDFYAPRPKYDDIAVWWEAPKRWRACAPMPVQATVAAEDVASVTLHFRCGQGDAQSVALAKAAAYSFTGDVPGSAMAAGELSAWLEVATRQGTRWLPKGASPASEVALKPFTVFEATEVTPLPEADGVKRKATIVAGKALRVEASGFGEEPNCWGFRLPANPSTDARYNTVCIRARGLRPGTTQVELGLVQADGAAFGCNVPLWPKWRDVRVPVSKLRPLWKTKPGRLDVTKLREISLVFGAWLYGSRRGEPHAYEVQRVWLERHEPCWKIDVAPADGPVTLCMLADHPIKVNGQPDRHVKVVPGSTPGTRAVRVWTKGFGPQPACISFRRAAGEHIDRWRDALKRCTAVKLVARAARPETNKLEVVLIERDNAPWGTVVPLTQEWREIVVPFTDLHFFRHWRRVPGRGGKGDRFRPANVGAVSFCFGAWLFGDRAGRPHGVEIERVEFVRRGR